MLPEMFDQTRAVEVLHTYLSWAIPGFGVFILFEVIFVRFKKLDYYRLNDSLTSLGCGMFTTTFEFFLKAALLGLYILAYEHLSLFRIEDYGWLNWVVGIVAFDFLWYWAHRVSHQVNVMWGGHETHHQPEEFNLSAGLRQGALQDLFYWPFYMGMAVLGFSAEMFVLHLMVNKSYGFLLHTKTVGKLPLVEGILSTPSAHRVHHGMNDLYLDRNHGGIFIFWDRLFGTYQEETEPVIFGVRQPYRSFDPVRSHFHWLLSLWKDAVATGSLKDKLKLWFMPTGWRPADVRHIFRGKLADLDDFQTWRVESSRLVLAWALVVFAILAGLNQALYAFSFPTIVSATIVVLVFVGLYLVGRILNSELKDRP